MGTIVIADCTCGYSVEGSVGGGMSDFQDVCLFPCLCEGCRALVDINLFVTPLRCPTCGSDKVTACDDLRMSLPPDEEEVYSVADWDATPRLDRQLELTNGRYRCPKCGQMSMRFEMSGLWD